MSDKSFYLTRREALLKRLPQNSLVVCYAAKTRVRNGDAEYLFRQDSNFYYLTGFNEPKAILVLRKTDAGTQTILFNQPRDPEKETWTGPILGQTAAPDALGVDEAYPFETFESKLSELFTGCEHFYYTTSQNMKTDRKIFYCLDQLRHRARSGIIAPHTCHDLAFEIGQLRLIKSAPEIEAIQTAVDISVQAHTRAMQVCKAGMKEYELEAALMHTFYQHGSRAPAYNNIVAAGKNACVLHYVDNQAEIHDQDLVLIDAGAEFQNYAADITRTFPANGRFTPEQKSIYELVLQAQLAAIEIAKPGTPWTDLQTTIVRILTQGLLELGILKGTLETLIETKAYQPFYMHNSGHWLGLDVHDAGAYKTQDTWCTLASGMVLTIEPGLYISPSETVDKKWWHIGVRIEDDILITPTGARVLSEALPKTVDEIEALMAGH